MLSSHRSEPIHIDVGNVFEPPGERNIRRERTLSKLLDAFNELSRHNPDEVDPIGSYYHVSQHSTQLIDCSQAIDVVQHASFEDDGDVRKFNVQVLFMQFCKTIYWGQLA
jgi:hypothetical protein